MFKIDSTTAIKTITPDDGSYCIHKVTPAVINSMINRRQELQTEHGPRYAKGLTMFGIPCGGQSSLYFTDLALANLRTYGE
jgi:hypothetical protein